MFVNVLLGLVSYGRRLFGNQMIINVTVLGEGGRTKQIGKATIKWNKNYGNFISTFHFTVFFSSIEYVAL